MSDANLRKGLIIAQGNPQHLDADSAAAMTPLPYIGKATKCDRVITNSGEVAGYDMRGW